MPIKNILPVKEGSDVTLYNVIEARGLIPTRVVDPANGEEHYLPHEYHDLYIVWRDEDGNKDVQRIKRPAMEIYYVKDKYRTFLTPREYIEMEKVTPAMITYESWNIIKDIVQEMKRSGDVVAQSILKDIAEANATGNYSLKKQAHKWPYVLMSDLDLETYYWIQLGYKYNTMHGHVIDKCFADIENDVYGMSSAETRQNMDPVNACTLIFEYDDNGPNKGKTTQVYTFLLRNHKRYPQQKDFENRLGEFYDACHKEFDVQTVVKGGKKKEINTFADYHIELFDNEKDLLQKIFDRINMEKPDLCEFWNMPYDMPKMKARMEILGMHPEHVMSDDDYFPFDKQFCRFHIDNRPIDIANRNSYIRMTSTTQYVDQMQHYAGIRKGRKAYGSNRLDNIAKIELGMGKREFPEGVDVTNACVKDYWDFVLYNIRDVWCQVLIDQVTNDSMALVYDMNQMNCPLYHLAKQTKYQRYIYYTWYLRKGFVPGNNVNVNYRQYANEDSMLNAEEALEVQARRKILDGILTSDGSDIDPDDLAELEDEESQSLSDIIETQVKLAIADRVSIFDDSINRKVLLQGGCVGDPDYNIANGMELIPGVRSKHFFSKIIDMDFSSEYPWAKFTRSLSRSTQYGRLIIPHKVSEWQNALPNGKIKRAEDTKRYIPGGEFVSDYLSQDILSFGTVWFNLPFVEDCDKMINDLLEDNDEY